MYILDEPTLTDIDDGEDWDLSYRIVSKGIEIGMLNESDRGFRLCLSGESECSPGCLASAHEAIIDYIEKKGK